MVQFAIKSGLPHLGAALLPQRSPPLAQQSVHATHSHICLAGLFNLTKV